MDDWIDVAEAARLLAVSPRQARGLAQAGILPARRVGRSWLLPAADVRSRAAHAPSAGRPMSPAMAWAALRLAQRWFDASPQPVEDADLFKEISDRQLRHRLRNLLAEPVPAQRWEKWLQHRAGRRRVWVHPGLLDRLASDARVRPGGGFAAAAHGLGIASAPPRRFYVDARAADGIIADYRARDDPAGQVELMVVPNDIAPGLLAGVGPVPAAVALADLLESDDARERQAAAERFERVAVSNSV